MILCNAIASNRLALHGRRVALTPLAGIAEDAHQRAHAEKCERRTARDALLQRRADPKAGLGAHSGAKQAISAATRRLAQAHHKLALLDAVQWACAHDGEGVGRRQHTQRVADALTRLQPPNETGLLGRRLAGTWTLADVAARAACGRAWPTLRSTDASDRPIGGEDFGGSIFDGVAPEMYLGQNARLTGVTLQWTPDDDTAQAMGRLDGVFDVSAISGTDIRLALWGSYFMLERDIVRVELERLRLEHTTGPDDGRMWRFTDKVYDLRVSYIDHDAFLGRCHSPYQRLWVKDLPRSRQSFGP